MTNTSKTLGGYLLEALEHRGITQAFGIPGVHNIELYRALPERRIHHVGGRHEQALGFMADGYARACGRAAACFTISGPGVTNIATAMAQAYADSIPMFVVASQNRRGEAGSGRGFLHEMPDQCGFAAQVSGFAHSLATVQELPEVLARAFARLSGARPRPVYLEIPRDLFAADASMLLAAPSTLPVASGAAPAAALQEAARRLRAAQRPVILAGGGAAGCAAEVRRLAETLQAPVVMTINGRGILPPSHALGLSFSASLTPVREFIAAADVTLAIGTELGPTDYDMYSVQEFPQPATLVRIDIDPEQMMRNAVPQVPLLGDAKACVTALLELLQAGPATPVAAARDLAPVREAAAAVLTQAMRSQITFLELLRDALPGHLLVGDSTQPVYAGNLGFAAAAPGTWFNSSTGFGTLGYALPAANGASLAHPQRPVIALAGDGGLQFTLAEFGTLRDLNGWVAVIIWNNRGFGEIKTSMIDAGVKPQAVDLAPPQWAALASAYGLPHRLVRDRLGLAEALRQFRAARSPLIIEIDADVFR
jgi:acetolactate synthase I/II/III large subunit